jgi:hypothetical protein
MFTKESLLNPFPLIVIVVPPFVDVKGEVDETTKGVLILI